MLQANIHRFVDGVSTSAYRPSSTCKKQVNVIQEETIAMIALIYVGTLKI